MVGGGWWWVAYSILVSAQGPLVFGFGFGGLRVWGQGLTIFVYNCQAQVKVWSGPAQKLIALDLGYIHYIWSGTQHPLTTQPHNFSF